MQQVGYIENRTVRKKKKVTDREDLEVEHHTLKTELLEQNNASYSKYLEMYQLYLESRTARDDYTCGRYIYYHKNSITRTKNGS